MLLILGDNHMTQPEQLDVPYSIVSSVCIYTSATKLTRHLINIDLHVQTSSR